MHTHSVYKRLDDKMKQLSQKRADQKLAKILKRERKNAKPAEPAPHYSNTNNPVDFPKKEEK